MAGQPSAPLIMLMNEKLILIDDKPLSYICELTFLFVLKAGKPQRILLCSIKELIYLFCFLIAYVRLLQYRFSI